MTSYGGAVTRSKGPATEARTRAPGTGRRGACTLYNSHVILLERYDAFLFDLDGVLYRGDEADPAAAEAIAAIRAAGKGVAFVTNNSSATPDAVVGRLERVGIAAQASEVETSALTTAALLARAGPGRSW